AFHCYMELSHENLILDIHFRVFILCEMSENVSTQCRRGVGVILEFILKWGKGNGYSELFLNAGNIVKNVCLFIRIYGRLSMIFRNISLNFFSSSFVKAFGPFVRFPLFLAIALA